MSKIRSRYSGADLVPDPDGEWISPDLPFIDAGERRDDIIHVFKEGERLDLLAWYYLRDPKLWWVIAEYNDISWAFDIEPGTQLRVPTYEHAAMDLLR